MKKIECAQLQNTLLKIPGGHSGIHGLHVHETTVDINILQLNTSSLLYRAVKTNYIP